MHKKNIVIFVLMILVMTSISFAGDSINVKIGNENVKFNEDTGRPFLKNSRTLVPLRVVTETLGLEVDWNNDLYEAIVKKENITVRVPIDESYIFKNEKKIVNDSQAVIVNGRTYLPIRVVLEAFNYDIGWDNDTRSVLVNNKETQPTTNPSNPITNISQNININGKEFKVQGYKVDLKNSDLEVKTALANDVVGSTSELKNIAESNDAILAVNGSYFAAYDETEIKDPYGILVVDGEIVHNANKRAVIGFKGKEMDIARVDTTIKGNNGKPDDYHWEYSWNGYWLNHSVLENGVSLTVYDNNRGEFTGSGLGKNYIIENGIITKVVDNQSVRIPENGYVATLYGQLGTTPTQVYDRFIVGNPFDFDVTLIPKNGSDEFWNTLDYGTGAGPALILEGNIDVDFEQEVFTEKKITEYTYRRSAIGYTQKGELIMITTSATIHELAKIMKKLGCYEAMALDSGASSGMYYKGKYVWQPGRDLSNIIYIK